MYLDKGKLIVSQQASLVSSSSKENVGIGNLSKLFNTLLSRRKRTVEDNINLINCYVYNGGLDVFSWWSGKRERHDVNVVPPGGLPTAMWGTSALQRVQQRHWSTAIDNIPLAKGKLGTKCQLFHTWDTKERHITNKCILGDSFKTAHH